MRNYIIISKEQAEAVRGRHGKYSALEPVEFPDGKFAVPERCIDDPEFADIRETLQKYRKEEIIQDITDLNETSKSTKIEKDKYYLSKDYWVVKGLKTATIDMSKVAKITDLKDTILVGKDVETLINGEGKIIK